MSSRGSSARLRPSDKAKDPAGKEATHSPSSPGARTATVMAVLVQRTRRSVSLRRQHSPSRASVAPPCPALPGERGDRRIVERQPGRHQDRVGNDGFGQGQRQRVAPGEADKAERLLGCHAQALRRFGHQHKQQAQSGQSSPGQGEPAPQRALRKLRRIREVGEQAAGHVEGEVVLAGHRRHCPAWAGVWSSERSCTRTPSA